MRNSRPFVAGGIAGLVLLGSASWVSATSLDCNGRDLTRTEFVVCEDVQLLRTEEQIARRADVIARRVNFGQYLGLRFWQAEAANLRDQCGVDRACIVAQYRTQSRTLDRLQQCVDTRVARRSCLRNALAGERETVRR